jgi:ribosomal protein S25
MNIIEMEQNIRAYVKQQTANGNSFPTAYDVAYQLDIPVSMADRALRNLNRQDAINYPYNSATDF